MKRYTIDVNDKTKESKKFLKRYPDMRIIVPHMGALEYDEFGALLDNYPNIYFDTSYNFVPKAKICFLSSRLGTGFLEKYQDRILYGSDFPDLIFPREDEIETLLSLNLSQSFYDKVFWKNGWEIMTSHFDSFYTAVSDYVPLSQHQTAEKDFEYFLRLIDLALAYVTDRMNVEGPVQ